MGVLDGIKILELARVPPAEMPAMILADMGAEVLKIDSPDPERPAGEDWVRRTIHSFTNRNKRSMTLDMKTPDGQAIFRKLAATADVFVVGFGPGVMKRLGADAAEGVADQIGHLEDIPDIRALTSRLTGERD